LVRSAGSTGTLILATPTTPACPALLRPVCGARSTTTRCWCTHPGVAPAVPPAPLVHTDRGGSRWPHIAFDAHRVVDPYSMTSSRAKYMCDVVERQSTLSRLPCVGRCCVKAAPKPSEPGTRRAIPTGPRCSSLPKVGSRDGRELTGRGPRCHARLRAILVAHRSSDWRQQRAPQPFSMLASTVTAALLHLVDCAEAGSPRPVSGDVAINLWIRAGLGTTAYLGGDVAGPPSASGTGRAAGQSSSSRQCSSRAGCRSGSGAAARAGSRAGTS
jgi:hypothetical protein